MSSSKIHVPIAVLLVEDSPGDVRLTREAFREADGNVLIHVASDGIQALAFLQQTEPFADAPRPDLILLDLNLPRMDGREVLARIKRDSALQTIPVVILTTSDAESDVMHSYEHHANCYLTKPTQLSAFEAMVRSLIDFWFTKAVLPKARPVQDGLR